MSNIINFEDRMRERRITPFLRRAEEMRRAARILLLNAEIMEAQAYGMAEIDYDVPVRGEAEDEKVTYLNA